MPRRHTIRIAHPTGASTATHTFEPGEPVEVDYDYGLALSRIKDAGFYIVDVIAHDPEPARTPDAIPEDADPDRLDIPTEVGEVGGDEVHSEHGAGDGHEEPAAATPAPAKRTARRSSAKRS